MKKVSQILLLVGVIVASGWVGLSLGFAGTGPLATQNCDTNGDLTLDLSDAIHLLTGLFTDVTVEPVAFDCPGPPPALQNGDCNGDDAVDLSDAVHLLTGLFVDVSVEPVPLVCPGEEEPTFAGSLTATDGSWNFLATQGLPGAVALCHERWTDSSVCTREQLLAAAAAGELVLAEDFEGNAVLSFWVHDPEAPPLQQCWSATTDQNWTYRTAHIAEGGNFVDLTPDTGELSEVQINTGSSATGRCHDVHWVPCCNQ